MGKTMELGEVPLVCHSLLSATNVNTLTLDFYLFIYLILVTWEPML